MNQYGADDIALLVDFLNVNIRDHEELMAETEPESTYEEYAAEDISF